MEELHQYEQFFYEPNTLSQLAEFVTKFEKICCVCTPLLGKFLVEKGKSVTILDIDTRFDSVAGFQQYNLYEPQPLEETYELLICDPPFQKISLSQLFKALRVLSGNNFAQPILLSFLQERANDVLGTFAPFQLQKTGYYPQYVSLRKQEWEHIEFFSNLEEQDIATLQKLGDFYRNSF